MGHLSLEQRYEIAALRKQNYSITKIGEVIGKHKSVVSRELRRNCDQRSGEYKAKLAQSKMLKRAKDKPKKIHFTPAIKNTVERLIKQEYSPEQISGYCRRMGQACVSHERIYQYVWKDKRSGGVLHTYLRSKGKKYASRRDKNGKRGQIVGRVDIDQRPKIVDEKERFGDLEIDLIIGKDHKGALLTINDRATGMLQMAILESKEAALVTAKTIELLQNWKPFLHTVTSDNGKEFALHQIIAKQLEVDYFFAKPYHSWERGANENLNGLVRQYFPKGSVFTNITDADVAQVVEKLNSRPRKRFGFLSPNEIFFQKMQKCA